MVRNSLTLACGLLFMWTLTACLIAQERPLFKHPVAGFGIIVGPCHTTLGDLRMTLVGRAGLPIQRGRAWRVPTWSLPVACGITWVSVCVGLPTNSRSRSRRQPLR